MKRFVIAAAVVAAASAVFAGTAAAQVTMSLNATPPNPVPLGGSVVFSGNFSDGGAAIPGTDVVLGMFQSANCDPFTFFGFEGFATTNVNGDFTFAPLDLATLQADTGTTATTFSFRSGTFETPISGCVVVTFGLAVQRQPDNTFLCYSSFEQDSGMVVPTGLVDQFLKGGYRKPFAVKGTAPSNAFTIAGAYYLSCNPASSLKATGFGVDLSGLDVYAMSVYGQSATIFPIVS